MADIKYFYLFFILNMTTGENHQFSRHLNSKIIPFNFCFNYLRYYFSNFVWGSKRYTGSVIRSKMSSLYQFLFYNY